MQPFDVNPPASAATSLTKAQLAELLFDQIGLNKRESKDMVDAFFELIVQELVAGNDVKLSGFGNFQLRTKASRPGRNPRTGQAIPIGARRVVVFHASSKTIFVPLDAWIRVRLRTILKWRQKKRGIGKGRCHHVWTNDYFAKLGLFTMTTARVLAGQSLKGAH